MRVPGTGPRNPMASPCKRKAGDVASKAQKSAIRAVPKLPRPPRRRATRWLAAARR